MHWDAPGAGPASAPNGWCQAMQLLEENIGEHPTAQGDKKILELSQLNKQECRRMSEWCENMCKKTCNRVFWAFYPLYKTSVFCVMYPQCTWWNRSQWISLWAACYLWKWQLKMARCAAEVLQSWRSSPLYISTAFKSCRFVMICLAWRFWWSGITSFRSSGFASKSSAARNLELRQHLTF